VNRRVVVTGLAPLCSLGQDADELWANLVAGRSGVTHVARLRGLAVSIGAEVLLSDERGVLGARERRLDRATQLALVAAHCALADAGLLADDGKCRVDERAGTILGTSRGATERLEASFERFLTRGPEGMSPHVSPFTTTGSLSAAVAQRFGLRGPNLTVSAACSSATQAIGVAFDAVRQGRADIMLAGGAEACLTPFCVSMLDAAGILSHRNDAPAAASRPFDSGRDGIVLGEGAAVLVLEAEEHALARGARCHAELAGFGASCDAYSLTGMPADGEGLVRAIRRTLEDAGVAPGSVDYINAHGTATRLGDRAEAQALRTCFGSRASQVPVSSTKSMTGHLLGAAGALEAVICALVLRFDTAPPTLNLEEPDPECRLDHVAGQARRLEARVALSTSMGFGGNNACLLLKRIEE
jgi:3-oxoacyl-[acyl-carrier-protein] synthase II